jgi:hypothetical protein
MPDLPCLDVSVAAAVLDEDYIAENDVITATVTLSHANLLRAGKKPSDPVPPVYAPHWPQAKAEDWHLFLTTATGDKLVVYKPVKGATLTAVAEEKLQFLAPSRAGRYVYRLHVRSAAYMGLDQVVEVPFEVKPASEVPAWEEHEEDTALENGPADVALEAMMGGGAVDESDTSEDEGGAGGGAGGDDSDGEPASSGGGAARRPDGKGVTGGQLPPRASVGGAGSAAPAAGAGADAAAPGGGDDDDALPSLMAGGAKHKKPAPKPAAAAAGAKSAAAAVAAVAAAARPSDDDGGDADDESEED